MLPNIRTGLIRSGRNWSDIDIAASGYTVYGENEEDIVKGLNGLRTPLSFYGSTQTYHEVLRLHGLEYLGQKLHSLSWMVSGRKCATSSQKMNYGDL
tara:strand:+ start:230 stop:520 length:291 start_codon:yes stop_codon:yes gene_type:complete